MIKTLESQLAEVKQYSRGVWVDLVRFNYSDSKFSILQGTELLLYNLKLKDGRIQSATYDVSAPMFTRVFTWEDYYESFEIIDSTQNFHLKQ